MRWWSDSVGRVPIERIALVAVVGTMRDALVRVAGEGIVEFDGAPVTPDADAALSITPSPGTVRRDLRAGEAQVDQRLRAAVVRGEVSAVAGWAPADAVPVLSDRVADVGAAVVVLPRPPETSTPCLLLHGDQPGRWSRPRNGTDRTAARMDDPAYATAGRRLGPAAGTAPHAGVHPGPLAAAAFLFMFGMTFGDVGHGALLLAAGAVLALWPRLARFRHAWPFVVGAGLAGVVFGFVYDQFFGPTGLPVAGPATRTGRPAVLMVAAIGIAAVLLTGAFILGLARRVRDAGWTAALYASAGIAGIALLTGLWLVAGGWYQRLAWLAVLGALLAVLGLALGLAGFLGDGGVLGAFMELFDIVVGPASTTASLTRLAALGLGHAALGLLVWEGTRVLWHQGTTAAVGAAVLFAAGNVLAFALEGLVVAMQAMPLEYGRVFARTFQRQGRPFRPWYVPIDSKGDPSWRPGAPGAA